MLNGFSDWVPAPLAAVLREQAQLLPALFVLFVAASKREERAQIEPRRFWFAELVLDGAVAVQAVEQARCLLRWRSYRCAWCRRHCFLARRCFNSRCNHRDTNETLHAHQMLHLG